MKQQLLSWKKIPLLLMACGIVLTVAFAQGNAGRQNHAGTDTIPTKQKKIHDLDEALAELDRGEQEMQRALKEIDREKMEREIREAMKNVDIDMARMKQDMERALKEIDMEKISRDVEKALKEIDSEKLKAEVQASLAKVDMEKIKAEMEKVKAIDVQKMKDELARVQPEIEKAMQQARVDIEKARKEMTSYKNLVNALEKDGLLEKGEHYTIAYKNKELTVNGRKLTAEATKKYSEYLDDKKEFTLKKNKDGWQIQN